MNSPHSIQVALATLGILATTSAEVVTWDGEGPDDLWTTGLNWSNDLEPTTGDEVTIGSIYSVSYDRSDASGSLPGGMTLNIEGTLDQTGGVIRTSGATIHVASTGSLSGSGFWDFNNSEITFIDGAKATMNSWENKGTNVFNFELGPNGFTTLTPNRFFIGGGATIADATFTVDMSDYTGGTNPITLVDFDQDTTGMTDTIFQGAGGLDIINPGIFPDAALHWNATEKSIVLVLKPKTWDGEAADNLWGTATNWDPDGVPEGGEAVEIGMNATVTEATNEFGTLTIQSGAKVTLDTDLGPGNHLEIGGTLDKAGVLRTNGASLNISGDLGTSITFLDTNSSTINFFDGAAFANSNLPFEHKGTNTFGYVLSSTGFTTLLAGTLHSGNSATWSDVTYNIDVSNYDISNGKVITLADYSSTTMTGEFSDAIVNIIAGDSGLNATLNFDPSEFQLVLTFDSPPAPLAITDLIYDLDSGNVTLTWTKTEAISYAAFGSIDLTNWETEIADNLSESDDENPDDGNFITATINLSGGILDNEERLFFRIVEE